MKLALAAVPMLLTLGCAQPQSPNAASGELTGTWRSPPIPSGSGTVLVLQQTVGTVRGQVFDYGIGPFGRLEDQGTVSGHCLGGLIDLQLHYLKSGAARFDTVFDSLGSLVGTWTPPPPAAPFHTTYYRQDD